MPSNHPFVYVSNAESLDVRVFRLDGDRGDLAPVQVAPVPDVTAPSTTSIPLAPSPDRRFLYAALRTKPYTVRSFRIDARSGHLTHFHTAPLPGSMAYLAPDRTGRFLLGASYPDKMLTVSPIGSDGAAGPAQQVLPLSGTCHAVMVDTRNENVYFTETTGGHFSRRPFDAASGAIDTDDGCALRVAVARHPRHFVFHPDDRFVFLLKERDATIEVFALEDGKLSLCNTAAVLPEGFDREPLAADLHLTPDGRFLYASERVSNTIAAFRWDPRARSLALVARYATEDGPRAMAIDPAGKFLLAAGQLSHALTVYRIDPDSGRLQALQSWPMGRNPSWIEILPQRE